jgi:hypothetical protein
MTAWAGASGSHGAGRQSASGTRYSARCNWSRAASDSLTDFTTTAPAPAPALKARRTPWASIRCSAEPAISGFFRGTRPTAVCSISGFIV